MRQKAQNLVLLYNRWYILSIDLKLRGDLKKGPNEPALTLHAFDNCARGNTSNILYRVVCAFQALDHQDWTHKHSHST